MPSKVGQHQIAGHSHPCVSPAETNRDICHSCCMWTRVLWQVARQRSDGDQLVVAGLGQTRDGCDLYTFILWAGSTRRDQEGSSCSVLYSDLLRAIGTPVPGETINGASHYGGSPLILLNKDPRMVAREHEGRPGQRRVNETKRLATDEPATRLVSARGVWRVFSKTFCQKVRAGQGKPALL